MRGVVGLALRTWLRYLVPLTLLSAIALAPFLILAMKTVPAANTEAARAQLRLAWLLGGTAWAAQLWLVAGVAPAVRGVASGAALSQWRALACGVANLVRGFVPWVIALAAVALGGLALLVPGLVIAVVVSLTGASERLGEPAPAAVRDSLEIVRANLKAVAIVVAAIVVADLAITLVAQLSIVPAIAKKATAAKLVPIRTFVRVVAAGLVVVSPLAACSLAALAARRAR